MDELRYPIGVQTFSELIKGGYVYVDKTKFILQLMKQGKYIFLSRPRRFGKSLFVTTLKAYFEGRRNLFKGLAIDKADCDWTPSPVLHFDFNTGAYLEDEGLHKRIDATLSRYEELYAIKSSDGSVSALPLRFENLIRTAHEATGRQVVILVDEYDKPMLALEEKHPLYEKHQRMLKNFYSNFKSMDEHIRFVFITGVARFSKVSIFSDLNNLDDISLEEDYADICGITEEELISTFRSGIEFLAEKRKENYNTTLKLLREYYDGYLFAAEGPRLYNPFSLLRTLKAKSMDPFWFETGTPTFLVNLIKRNRINPQGINGRMCSKRELMRVNLNSTDPVPLMFQTGYLTIDHYDRDLDAYILRFPNREVEISFAEDLLPKYVQGTDNSESPFSILNFRKDLFSGNPQDFMKRLSTVFKDLPSEDQNESVYRAVTYLVCKLCSLNPLAEHHGFKGRSDLEVVTSRFIYLFEFKYNKSIQEALNQIYDRDYAGRFALDSKQVFIIGANYVNTKNDKGLYYDIKVVE
ncbi:MAG: AAA family ATPase [Bacteroides sp.]|nr:AAA family ATPase [Bacteroides sp.]